MWFVFWRNHYTTKEWLFYFYKFCLFNNLLLANNRGQVFSTEDIFLKVWKEQYYQSDNTVMVHISRIRDKIEKYMDGNKLIKTVWGVGYKIEK